MNGAYQLSATAKALLCIAPFLYCREYTVAVHLVHGESMQVGSLAGATLALFVPTYIRLPPQPTLNETPGTDDWVVVNKASLAWSPLRRGEVAVLTCVPSLPYTPRRASLLI